MRRVLVVCAAGASSTFLVHWMRRIAADRGLLVTIEAASVDLLESSIAPDDTVLVGAHLGGSFPAIAAMGSRRGAEVSLLPPLAFDATGAASALDLAAEHLSEHHHREPENSIG